MSGEGNSYAPRSPVLDFSADDNTVQHHHQHHHHPEQQQPQQQNRQNQPQLHLNPPQDYYQIHPQSQSQYQDQGHYRSPSYAASAETPTTSSYQQQPLSATSVYSPRFSDQIPHYPQHHNTYYNTPTSAISPQTPAYNHSAYDLSSHQQTYQQPYGDTAYAVASHPSQQQQQGYSPSQPQPQYYLHDDSSAQPHIKPESPLDLIKPEFPPEDDTKMPPRRAAAQAPEPPAIDPSPVKTKFPTARIKRIMQADEEVGKVAQQTPIAVGKALEMFMIQLVSKSADVAKDKNSKRVTAQMLKTVVESDDQWDFLRDIVGKVETEEKAAKSGGRAKVESESEEELEAPEVPKKKARGRKKKTA